MHLGNAENMMPDDFGSYDQEVERRIMSQNVNPRPKQQMRPNYPRPVANFHKPPTPAGSKMVRPTQPSVTSKKHIVDEIIDEINASEEAELTREILDAARKANVSIYGVLKEYSIYEEQRDFAIMRTNLIKDAIRKSTGWIGPG